MEKITGGPQQLLAGLKLLSKPGIRLYVIIPLLLNTLLFSLIIFFGASRLNDLINWLTSNWTWTSWLSWLLWPLFALISMTIVFFCFSVLANFIAAPFNGFLSEAVAAHLESTPASKPFNLKTLSKELPAAFKAEIIKLSYFLVRALPLLLLFFIPFIQAFAPVIWFIFGSWMLALEYMEYPMGNEGILFPQVRETLSSRRSLTFSFGGSVMLLTMIPVINFIAMPAAVAAATKIWIEEINADSKAALDVAK